MIYAYLYFACIYLSYYICVPTEGDGEGKVLYAGWMAGQAALVERTESD